MKKVFASCLVVAFALAACGSGGAAVGATCSQNSDCASGACGGGPDCHNHCVCQSDSDCPSGSKCMMTVDCGNTCG